MNDKLVFRNVLQCKNREKPPFVPFVCGLAARTANVNIRRMVTDPGYYASALEGFNSLLGAKVVTANFDASMEGEALGAEVLWPGEYDAPIVKTQVKPTIGPDDFLVQTRTAVVIETVNRLSLTSGPEKAVACALLGPCAFIHMLKGAFEEYSPLDPDALVKQYGGYLTKLVRKLCEQKIDALFFREDSLCERYVPLLSDNQSAFKSLYTTLFNIVRAFNAFPLIIADRLAFETIGYLYESLKPSGIVLFGSAMDPTTLGSLLESTKGLKMSIGLPLPFKAASHEALWHAMDIIESVRSNNKLHNIFYCSDGEIPHDIDLSILLELMDRIKDDND